MAKKTAPKPGLSIPNVGVISEGILLLDSTTKEVTLRTPGTIAEATDHQRQYVDILARETERETGVPISLKEVVVPPSKTPTRIFFDVKQYRLLLLESIAFPANGRFNREKSLPKKKRSAKK